MKANLIRKVNGCVAIAALVICPFLGAPVLAISLQNGSSTASRSAVSIDKPGAAKTPVLVRNTPAKTEVPAAETTAPKEEKTHDKQTISRCWKRLMTMVREANHTHKKNQQ